MSIGDGTSIPKGSTFYCTEAELKIGKKLYLVLIQLLLQEAIALMSLENTLWTAMKNYLKMMPLL